MKDIIRLVLVFFFAISIPCKGEDVPIKGWIILSDNMDNAIATIKAAKGYKINHLQLSHQIIHNLMEVKNESVRNLVRNLTRLAHQEGIGEVLVWDHSFYEGVSKFSPSFFMPKAPTFTSWGFVIT